MKFTHAAKLALLTPILLSACASTPDPAEVCTANWIAPRAERAVKKIETKTKRSIKALTNASESWTQGKTPGPLQLFALSRAVKSLETEFKNGKGIQDLRTVAKTCNDPQIISDSLRGMFERQGVSDKLITQVEGAPIYKSIIASVLKEDPKDEDASLQR